MFKLSYQKYLDGLYKDKSGYIGYQLEEKELSQKHQIDLTYGEIIYQGVDAIIDHLVFNEEDVFYDLGSGIGKVVLQLFLKTPVKKSIGIEASTARHNCAEEVFNVAKKEYQARFQDQREFKSIQGNFLLHPIVDATVVFTNSRCFNDEMLVDLAKILNNCPLLKQVISLQPMSLKLPFKRTVGLECSWLHGKKTKCYLYSYLK